MDVMARIEDFLKNKGILAYREALLRWYGPYGRDLPWRRDFRSTGDPYPVWVSEIMLQQTQIAAVMPAYDRFMLRFPSVVALAHASVEEVCEACHGLGYYRRFRFMHETARALASHQDELPVRWPQSYAAWRELKGIGAYSAAAIASIVLGAPHAVVDGNVERIFCRLLDIRLATKDPALGAPFADLAARLLVAEGGRMGDGKTTYFGDYNQALMELGQRVCTRRSPACDLCPLHDFCAARARGSQHLAPAAREPQKVLPMTVDLFIKQDSVGRIALVMRDETSRFLKQSLGFPWRIGEGPRQEDGSGRSSPQGFRHAITHHRLDVRVQLGGDRLPRGAVRWVARGEVSDLLVASLDRKAWRLAEPLL